MSGGHDLRLTTGELPRVTSKRKKKIEPARARVKTKMKFLSVRSRSIPTATASRP